MLKELFGVNKNIIHNIKEDIRKVLINILGWRTNKKIVVIESDDWGSIRMQSRESYEALKAKGYQVDNCGYNRFDSLESNDDLEALLNTLVGIKNAAGQNPIFTLNNVVANPDFDMISFSKFKDYFYEPFPQTLERYSGRERVMSIYRQAISNNLIIPQFHGREHVNIKRWLNALQNSEIPSLDAFKHRMFSLHANSNPKFPMEFMDSFECQTETQLALQEKIINEGLTLFENIWGFKSETFIAPCFSWHRKLNKVLSENGVIGLQGMYYQNEPNFKSEKKYNTIYHYLGQRNNVDQCYLVRNVIFEPALTNSKDSVLQALNEIDLAFRLKKPAIISSHRVNYIGSIFESNRINNLISLKQLLKKVVEKYPDVEFMSSNLLAYEILKSN